MRPTRSAKPIRIFRRPKLLWCQLFHRVWRRRVALLQVEGSQRFYEIRCVKCGARESQVPPRQAMVA